jgi:hypothetical protein
MEELFKLVAELESELDHLSCLGICFRGKFEGSVMVVGLT